jgi:hypothetical protein
MTATLKAPGYNPSRPYVFSLTLNNGSTHLFQAPTPETLIQWKRTLNYWAALRSKESLRGAVGNTEYGWGFAMWDLRNKNAEIEASKADSDSASNGSAGNSSTPTSSGRTSGSFNGFLPNNKSRKFKIEDWAPPGGIGMVVSLLPEVS